MSYEVRPYKGKEGSWEYDIKIRLPNGKEYRERKKSKCRGKEDTKRWAAEREHHLQQLARSGELERQTEIPTVAEFWPRFVEGVMVANQLEPSSIRVKTSQYKNWVLPHLGTKRLDEIGGEEVAKFKAMLQQAPIAWGSITSILIILRMMLEAAVDWDILTKAPKIKGPKPGEVIPKIVPHGDFENVVLAARQESPEALALVLLTGECCLRVGEVMGLWWDAVDLERGKVHVKRNLHEGALNPYTKNKKKRSFRISPRTVEALKALRALPRRREDYVFVAPGGGPWYASLATRLLKKVFARAEIERRGPHALRHCGVTRMGRSSVPPALMLKVTGHADLSILQRYLHLEDDDTDVVIERLAELTPAVLGDMQEKREGAKVVSIHQKRRKRA